jgi:membrane glycosyltransferase
LLTLLLVYSLAFIDKESVVEDQQEQTKGVDAPETQQVTKTRSPVGLFLEKQKRVEELSLSDVFMWRNVFVSGILFILTHAIYLLLTRYQFTVITLVGRVIQIQVIIFFLYIVFARIVKNTSGK